MAVGRHYTSADWNNLAGNLRDNYLAFAQLAQTLANAMAPYDDNTLAAMTGFSVADVQTLRAGVNVSDALRKLAEGDQSQAPTAAGVSNLMVAKFGGA